MFGLSHLELLKLVLFTTSYLLSTLTSAKKFPPFSLGLCDPLSSITNGPWASFLSFGPNEESFPCILSCSKLSLFSSYCDLLPSCLEKRFLILNLLGYHPQGAFFIFPYIESFWYLPIFRFNLGCHQQIPINTISFGVAKGLVGAQPMEKAEEGSSTTRDLGWPLVGYWMLKFFGSKSFGEKRGGYWEADNQVLSWCNCWDFRMYFIFLFFD